MNSHCALFSKPTSTFVDWEEVAATAVISFDRAWSAVLELIQLPYSSRFPGEGRLLRFPCDLVKMHALIA